MSHSFIIRKSMQKLTLPYDILIGSALTVLGIIFRVAQYFHNRSLWLDEASLAMNILDRSLTQMFLPLDNYQAAPLGFLLIVKGLAKFFGTNEYVLRLVPLISGIVLIPLFYFTARKFLNKNMALVALFLINFSPSLIYYSTEFKPYSSDALICLALFLLACLYWERDGSTSMTLMLGVTGALAIWFSFPAVFILAGVGLTLASNAINKKRRRQLAILVFIGLCWLASFMVEYHFSLQSIDQNAGLDNYWTNYFAPFPLHTYADFKWYIDHSLDILQTTTQIPLQGLVLFCFLLGAVAYFYQNRTIFFFALSPIPALLTASAMHFYPIADRMLVFYIPILFLIIIKGISYLHDLLPQKAGFVTILLVCLICYFMADSTINNLITPSGKEEIRTVMQYARQNWHDGDNFYVYYYSIHPFEYYARSMRIPPNQYVFGKVPKNDYDGTWQELAQFKGRKRVWFIYSHLHENDLQIHLYTLRNMGKEIQSYQTQGASIYLFDLSGN